MGFSWRKGDPQDVANWSLRVHSLPCGSRSLICFLSDAEGIFSHIVHWLSEQKRSFPCLGPEKCPVCPMPTDTKWYAPVLIHNGRLPGWQEPWQPKEGCIEVYDSLTWEPKILEITKSWNRIVTQAQRGFCFHVRRTNKGGRWTQVHFEAYSHMRDLPERMMFDPRDHLPRTWGIRPEAA